jgi:hypothetical protein
MKKRTAWAAVLPCLVAGSALLWISVRPCEPVAQAQEPSVLKIWPPIEVVSTAEPPEVDVESLPRMRANPPAHPAHRPAMACNEKNPAWHCDYLRPSWSSVGQFITECDCSRETVLR